MTILYLFQIKSSSKKVKNTIKRRFYYNFKKLNKYIKIKLFLKNQIFLIENEYQNEIDLFFKDYLDWIDYYKINIEDINFITKIK